ncbi:uncharacterized protein [Cardiocondyla obscurior]|uniref:uncharacterized protein n=1 Tax=Cardiocondyla obscurior TaxID=286306 RepID=UPI0039656B25
MTPVEARILLQRSRFNWIQTATDLNDEEASPISRQLAQSQLTMLDSNWNKFQIEHEDLCLNESLAIKDHPYMKEKLYERCQAFYIYARAKLLAQDDDLEISGVSSEKKNLESCIGSSHIHRNSLPRVKIPTFSGDYQSWPAFQDLFVSVIRSHTALSEAEKMQFLKTSLTGEAAKIIKNLKAQGHNFRLAWKLLVSRYENKRFLINAELDRLAQLKPLKVKSAAGLRSLLSDLLESLGSLEALGCQVKFWDPIIIHHFSGLLDTETREAWELSLGVSRTYPKIDEFEEFLIGRAAAAECMKAVSTIETTKKSAIPQFRKPFNRTAFQVVNPQSNHVTSICPMCNENHALSNCNKYLIKTVKQRLDFVMKNRRCLNCLGTHIIRNCKSVRRCYKCGKRHHTFIHEGQVLPSATVTNASQLPPYNLEHSTWPHIKKLQLADPQFMISSPIDIIIEADFYGVKIKPGLIVGDNASPLAQQTLFGWVISGPTYSNIDTQDYVYAHHCTKDAELQEILTKFWHQEEVSVTDTIILSEEDEKCEQHFLSTHRRDKGGRYIVRLPFSSDPTKLGESKSIALSCLNRMSQRFTQNPEFYQLYSDFLSEYLNLGHMALTEHQEKPHFYLPHHGVMRAESSTTKLRVVFNGSSRTSTGLSLNDVIFQGTKLQRDIIDILIWIRTHKVLFSTDVEKMFRQISLHSDDWNYQRILWQERDGRINSYCLTTVTYGLNCAPFLAMRTLQQLVEDERDRYPLAVTPMTKGRYVDDIFGGAESLNEAKEVIQQLIGLCGSGKFPLQKWSSNHPEILPNKSTQSSLLVETDVNFHKILGVGWKPTTDEFLFSVLPSKITTFSKKNIASDIARIYDPLGLSAPVIIKAKIILQEIWLLKIGWDKPLPDSLQQKWLLFRQQLLDLNNLKIPRWIQNVRCNFSVELHGFADASQLAMAAAVYLRVTTKEDSITSQLLCAKTKVCPLKRLTIPRLELTAALLLARLVVTSSKVLDLSITSITCWSDSSLVLTWLKSHPSRYKDFIHNRITSIYNLLPNCTWNYIPGRQNPADCATRGLRPDQLKIHPLWWNGPIWLSKPKEYWLAEEEPPNVDGDLEERPGNTLTTAVSNPPCWELLTRYSSFTKLKRVVAYCFCFINGSSKKSNSSHKHLSLTPAELENSIKALIGIVQRTWFQYELCVIQRGEKLSKSNPLIRLLPFIDQDGLLRVGGRLNNALIDADAKHQYILPKCSPLTSLITNDAHYKTLHGGTQVTLNLIRNKFWIIGGRIPVRSYILKCVTCARYRGLRAQQQMGQLPAARVSPGRAFLNTGLDYAGPIQLKTWKGRAARTYKGYLAIFVCLATSALHIEVVTDYSTDAFIAAFKRFTGRRGICATLLSDCGTNFVGADAELRRMFDNSSEELHKLANLLANDGTKWHFNPPSAPHFGGKWESAVKSVKFHLRRMLKDTILTFEEMTTIIIQIECFKLKTPKFANGGYIRLLSPHSGAFLDGRRYGNHPRTEPV